MGPVFDDLHEARKILECEVAALAAGRANDEDTARLARTLEDLRASLGDPAAFADAAFAFHLVLFESARNRVLLRMAAPIREVLAYTIQVASAMPGALETGLLEREAIYRAVIAGDSAAARNAMAAHLDRLHRTVGAGTPITTN
jgi:DNA-binding FadR family transcriptional regulator